ncbi:DnaD domain-containing protein [Lapidilactobacillus achengensis]|uniref:DnaD domain-containing protein n=1 Tax=Lapidilactobacillus achengensis TaxID=2486000 RepID=A0ABW1UQ62_9LACO|nr:DnaD domain protein [Lapidilactobacillus achengensis]
MTEFTINDLVGTSYTVIANLILDHYAELGMNDHQLAIFLQIVKYSQRDEKFPSPDQLALVVKKPVGEVYQVLSQLTQQHFISVTTDTYQEQHRDQYSVAPFFQRVAQLRDQQQAVQTFQAEQAEISKLYKEFQVEFGRTLSPFEMETIDNWLNRDRYSVDLIRLALREAVLSDARSLRYIDRILLDWQKRHITNATDLQKYKAKFN